MLAEKRYIGGLRSWCREPPF